MTNQDIAINFWRQLEVLPNLVNEWDLSEDINRIDRFVTGWADAAKLLEDTLTICKQATRFAIRGPLMCEHPQDRISWRVVVEPPALATF